MTTPSTLPPQEPTSLASLHGSTNTPTTTSTPTTLPLLPYTLRAHKCSILLIWTLLLLDAAILPLALFYPLWYGSSLDPAYIFAITTSVFGMISGVEWGFRSWALWKKEELRPLGGGRKGFDCFHVSYTIGYTVCLIELIIGSAPSTPLIRLCALPTPTFTLFSANLLLLTTLLSSLSIPSPIRISSQPAGSLIRPFIYTIIEDVIAVDTCMGRTYRRALDARWEASPLFRQMLHQLNMFWGISALVVGAGVTAAVLTERVPQEVAYGIGWGVPPIWAGIWVLITIRWVQVSLRREKEAWGKCENGV